MSNWKLELYGCDGPSITDGPIRTVNNSPMGLAGHSVGETLLDAFKALGEIRDGDIILVKTQ